MKPSHLTTAAFAAALTSTQALDLVVAFTEGWESQTLDVPVSASDATAIAAAAFTVAYDTDSLETTASSTYFTPFAAQLAATGAPSPTTAVTIGDTTYDQPLVTREIPGTGLAVAAVRRAPAGEPGPAVILTLHVSLKPGATPGLYPLTITPTLVADPTAGYDPAGEPLDLLLAADLTALPVTTTGGFARFAADIIDLDADGLPDDYETTTFGNTTASDGTTDTDRDSLSDLLEWLLGTDPKAPGTADFLVSDPQPDGSFHLDFPARTDHAINLSVEWSADLKSFTTTGVTITPLAVPAPAPDVFILRATIIPPADFKLRRILARVAVSP